MDHLPNLVEILEMPNINISQERKQKQETLDPIWAPNYSIFLSLTWVILISQCILVNFWGTVFQYKSIKTCLGYEEI
jgi:hypothetical protein